MTDKPIRLKVMYPELVELTDFLVTAALTLGKHGEQDLAARAADLHSRFALAREKRETQDLLAQFSTKK